MRWLRRWFTRSDRVSAIWLAEHAHRGDRIEFHGVNIRFPIRKLINEAAPFNTRTLRRRA